MPGSSETGFSHQAAIVTRRLVLRRETVRERGEIAALFANPRIADCIAAAPGWNGGSGEAFVIVERDSRAVVGLTGYGPMADRVAAIEVATCLAEPFWGRGYATEASQAIVDHAFAETGAPAIWCSNRVANARARRVIEKCGFQFRETGMVRSPARRGAMPVERYVLDRRNWASLKSWAAGALREVADEPRDNAA